MTTFTQLTLTSSDPPEPFTDRLRLAVAAYLARFKGSSREHTESDLRCYLVLPGAEDADEGGVHVAHEESGDSGSVVGEVPGGVGKVP